MIKGIAFDIDGTLLDHRQAQERALGSLYSIVKNKIPHSNLKEFFSTWKARTEQYINEYLAGRISFKQQRILRVQSVFLKWGCQLSSQEAWDIFKEYLIKYEHNWTLYEDVLPCLNMLKNLPLGVISNGNGKQQRKKLVQTGIDSFFRSIIISGEVDFSKPKPEIFKMSAKELGLSLDEILYVGDHLETDVLGALNAGMQGVWIKRTNQNHGSFNIITISSLSEIASVVEKIQ